jgi:single-stranded DNA-binding protein
MSIKITLSDATVSQDPELKYFDSGNSVLKVKVRALNGEKKADGEQYAPAEWITVEIWNKLGVTLAEKIHKHTAENPCRLFVLGNLVTRTYQANDGSTKTELLIKNPSDIVLLDRKFDNESAVESTATTTKRPSTPAAQTPNTDDCPF